MRRPTPPDELFLHPDLTAARSARAFVRARLPRRCDEQVAQDVELLATELVTNAVRHARPPIVLHVACGGDAGVLVEVSDTSTRPPAPRRARPGDLGGRGMLLVDVLATSWGVDLRQDGKTVWFTVRPPGVRAA